MFRTSFSYVDKSLLSNDVLFLYLGKFYSLQLQMFTIALKDLNMTIEKLITRTDELDQENYENKKSNSVCVSGKQQII